MKDELLTPIGYRRPSKWKVLWIAPAVAFLLGTAVLVEVQTTPKPEPVAALTCVGVPTYMRTYCQMWLLLAQINATYRAIAQGMICSMTDTC